MSQTVGSDELLLAIADRGQIAALSHLAADPTFSAVADAARGLPQLERSDDAEGILKFAPTLVLFADYSRLELVEQVRRAGVSILVFDHYATLDDAYANLRSLARALGGGALARASAVIEDCRQRVENLGIRLAGCRPVRVIAPSTYGVIPGSETTFQDLCDHAGAENLAVTLGRLHGHAPPPAERMLAWPIEMAVLAGETLEGALTVYRGVPPYSLLPAIRERRAVLLAPWQLACVTHYRVQAYERLARQLHPDRFGP